MKTIRQSIFETNSSSMHSITLVDALDKTVHLSGRYYNEISKVYTIPLFDREDDREVLTTPEDKIRYLVTQVCAYKYTKTEAQRFLNNFDKKVDNESNLELVILDEIRMLLKSSFNIRKILIDYDYGTNPEVDSEAIDTAQEFIRNNDTGMTPRELIKDIILNPDYFILMTYDGYPYIKFDTETEETYYDFPPGLIRPSEVTEGLVEVEDNCLYIGRDKDRDTYFDRIYIFGLKKWFDKDTYEVDECIDLMVKIKTELLTMHLKEVTNRNLEGIKDFNINYADKLKSAFEVWRKLDKYKNEIAKNKEVSHG